MAARKKKSVRAVAPLVPLDGFEEPDRRTDVDADDDEPTEEENDLDAVLAELIGDAEHVVLWRLDGPTGGKSEHVDKVQLSRFSAEYVRERHGGGDYLMRAYGPKLKGGRRGVKRYKEFSIDKSVPPKTGSAAVAWSEKHGTPMAPSVVHVPATKILPPWLETALIAGVPALMAGLVTWMTSPKTADPLLVELVRANGNGGKGVDPVELQRLLADERDRAIQLGKDMGRGGRSRDDGDDTATMITEGIRTIGTFAEGYREKAKAEADAIRRGELGANDAPHEIAGSDGGHSAIHPGPERTMGVSSSNALPSSIGGSDGMTGVLGDRLWVARVRPQIGAVVMMAGAVHPATAAQVIGDVLDDDAFNDLLADIDDDTGGGVLVRLVSYFPQVATVNVVWITAVIDAIVASTVEDTAADTTIEEGGTDATGSDPKTTGGAIVGGAHRE